MDVRFACPLCKSPLTELRCAPCGVDFSSTSGIPSFICREMYENPHTTTYSLGECRHLFSQFTITSLVKTGEALKHLAIVGRYVPEFLDRPLYSLLGPCINIVAVKPEL